MCIFFLKYYACWDYRTIASAWCKDYCNTGIPCTGDKRMYYPTEVDYTKKCGDCKDKERPPCAWEHLINRKPKRYFSGRA